MPEDTSPSRFQTMARSRATSAILAASHFRLWGNQLSAPFISTPLSSIFLTRTRTNSHLALFTEQALFKRIAKFVHFTLRTGLTYVGHIYDRRARASKLFTAGVSGLFQSQLA